MYLENISPRLLVSFQLFSITKHKYFTTNRKYKLYLTAAQHISGADVVNCNIFVFFEANIEGSHYLTLQLSKGSDSRFQRILNSYRNVVISLSEDGHQDDQ